MFKRYILAFISAGILCGSIQMASAEGAAVPAPVPVGTPSIVIDIPRVDTSATRSLGMVTATVSFAADVTTTAPVTLMITDTDAGGDTWSVTLPAGDTSTCSTLTPPLPAGVIACHKFAAVSCPGNDCADEAVIIPVQNTQPGSSQYQIEFDLYAHFNRASNCSNPPTVHPIYHMTVAVASGPNITGVCLESYDVSSALCLIDNGNEIQPQLGAFVDPGPAPTTACYINRPVLDLALVLDKSGSMAAAVDGTVAPNVAAEKISQLRSAVSDMVTVWNTNAMSGDNIGIALFDSNPSWWTQGGVDFNATHFQRIGGAAGGIQTNISTCQQDPTPASCTLVPGSSTSIGGGLLLADQNFPADSNRKVILLMSDGMQNTDPQVQFAQNQVRFYCADPTSATCAALLPNPSCTQPFSSTNSSCGLPIPAQIYTVTLGVTPGANEAVNQAIANNSKGFFINNETSPTLLRPFFLELLQNFLKFNSYDTVRMVSESTPYSANVPLSTTSRDVKISLMWPNNLGALRLTITPPGGAQPIVQESASGFISFTQSLPLSPPYDPMGDWKILVESVGVIGAANPALALTSRPSSSASTSSGVPFDLHVMTDDGGVKSDLSIVPGDYKPGDNIRLRAKLTHFGRPILGLGSRNGDKIEVQLIKPGNSVGDVLSDSNASTASSCPPPGPCDQQTPAEAKLANTLKGNPSALTYTSDTVQLFDDGKPEHGDDVAGDGIYSALYPANLVGHYNFLFSIESTDPNAVRFSRQQLRTAYVRDFPDSGQTILQSSLQPCAAGSAKGCNTLVITMSPRTKFGNRMGPGWGNYFWFTAPGVTPFKAADNLNGTYTAKLNFNGNKPPDVSVHFENVIAIIGDSVPPGGLPQPLDGNNTLGQVPPPLHKRAAFLDIGAGFPHGSFSSGFNIGFSLNAGLEYTVNPHISVEGIFGVHHFPANLGSNLNVYQFSTNAKFYLTAPPCKWRPFLNFGPGAYKFSPGSWNIGGNFGAGILREFAQLSGGRFGLQGSYNFHIANSSGGATKFSTFQAGIRYAF